MADTKISALASAGALAGTELVPIVQGGATVKVALDDLVPLVEAELPSFFATMRGMSPGDDPALNAYATDLDTYVADIDQAQDLLDAAQAAGSVTTAITILAGGGGAVPTYSTLAAVIADIAATTLVNGDSWRIAWTGDTYEADGEVVGTVIAGAPSWRGVIPWPKIGTTASVLASGTSGALSADGAGRPVLTVIANASSFVEVDLGLELRTPTFVQLNSFLTMAAPSNSSSSVLALQLMRTSDSTLRLWNYLVFVGSAWQSGHFQTSAGSGVAASVGDSTNASQFAGGRKLELIMRLPSERKIAQPLLYVTGRTPAGGVTSEAFTTVIGTNGDFTSAQDFKVIARASSTGTAQNLVVTGVALDAIA